VARVILRLVKDGPGKLEMERQQGAERTHWQLWREI
jgi:hypothetical protein